MKHRRIAIKIQSFSDPVRNRFVEKQSSITYQFVLT